MEVGIAITRPKEWHDDRRRLQMVGSVGWDTVNDGQEYLYSVCKEK